MFHIIFRANGIDIRKLPLIFQLFCARMFMFSHFAIQFFFLLVYFLLFSFCVCVCCYCKSYRQNDIESNIGRDQKNGREEKNRNMDETNAKCCRLKNCNFYFRCHACAIVHKWKNEILSASSSTCRLTCTGQGREREGVRDG